MLGLPNLNKISSSRIQIEIEGLRQNILTLPNRQHRALLKVGSVNFDLKSEAEQDSIIDNYQVFLNSLPCPIQILFRVREIDLENYLTNFKQRLKTENKAIYKRQINDYTNFVNDLVSDNKILTRNFYVTVEYTAAENEAFDSIQEKISLYLDIICEGFQKLGVKTERLSSLEILDLFYSFYSPEKSKYQTITDRILSLINQAYI
jgi:hypothetical protein